MRLWTAALAALPPLSEALRNLKTVHHPLAEKDPLHYKKSF
jgi:hypothetical protein